MKASVDSLRRKQEELVARLDSLEREVQRLKQGEMVKVEVDTGLDENKNKMAADIIDKIIKNDL